VQGTPQECRAAVKHSQTARFLHEFLRDRSPWRSTANLVSRNRLSFAAACVWNQSPSVSMN